MLVLNVKVSNSIRGNFSRRTWELAKVCMCLATTGHLLGPIAVREHHRRGMRVCVEIRLNSFLNSIIVVDLFVNREFYAQFVD